MKELQLEDLSTVKKNIDQNLDGRSELIVMEKWKLEYDDKMSIILGISGRSRFWREDEDPAIFCWIVLFQ